MVCLLVVGPVCMLPEVTEDAGTHFPTMTRSSASGPFASVPIAQPFEHSLSLSLCPLWNRDLTVATAFQDHSLENFS